MLRQAGRTWTGGWPPRTCVALIRDLGFKQEPAHTFPIQVFGKVPAHYMESVNNLGWKVVWSAHTAVSYTPMKNNVLSVRLSLTCS